MTRHRRYTSVVSSQHAADRASTSAPYSCAQKTELDKPDGTLTPTLSQGRGRHRPSGGAQMATYPVIGDEPFFLGLGPP